MNTDEALTAIPMVLLGAGESVHIMCAAHSGWTFPVGLDDVTASCDSRLDLRYIVRSRAGRDASAPGSLKRVVGNTWDIRQTEYDNPSANCIIVDREFVFLSPTQPQSGRHELYYVEQRSKVEPIAGLFERLWERANAVDRSQFTYEDLLDAASPTYQKEIVVASQEYWNDIIRRLAAHPDELRSMKPRAFEELVAELLQRDGAEVQLTPQTRDGGRDILATYDTPVGKHLCLVECKRHAKNNPVDVSIVRELYGILAIERATAAMIATTSYFTADAVRFRAPIQYQMSYKDFDEIKRWLARITKR